MKKKLKCTHVPETTLQPTQVLFMYLCSRNKKLISNYSHFRETLLIGTKIKISAERNCFERFLGIDASRLYVYTDDFNSHADLFEILSDSLREVTNRT